MMEIQNEILTQLEHFDVLSFDIFDTLLLRPVMNPNDIFEIVERETGAKGFAKARMEAGRLSLEHAQKNDKEDRTIDDIYGLMPSYAWVKEKELTCEKRFIVGNPEIINVFNTAKKLGKLVIIASDMYLPKSFLVDVLNENGVSGWDEMFLSNEIDARKSTGTMWDRIVQKLGSEARILHIGDDDKSDFHNAKQYGVVSYKYEKVVDAFVENSPFVKKFCAVAGRGLEPRCLVAAIAVACHLYRSMHADFGYWDGLACAFLSVIGYSYSRYIVDDAKGRNIDRLLLLARDGYNLEPLINILAPELKTQYIYAPRRDYLVAFQNFVDNSYEPRRWLTRKNRLNNNGSTHKRLLLTLLKDWIRPCDRTWKESDEEDFLSGGTASVVLQHAMDKFSEYVKSEYSKYIDSLGLQDNQKIGLVDFTSVRGTAHRFLMNFINEPIQAYYYFQNTGHVTDWDFPNTSAYIKGDPSLCLAQGIVEFFFSAPTPSVVCVRDCMPVYDSDQSFYNKYQVEMVNKVREPIIYVVSLLARWNLQINAKMATDWNESFLGALGSKDKSMFSFVQEYYGVSNRLYFSPIEEVKHRVRRLKFAGRTVMSVQIVVCGLCRYLLFKAFGRIPILKLRIPFD